jgi:rubredoxin
MASHARERQQVGLQAGAARRIGSGEREHDRWKGGSVGCGHDDAARIAPGTRWEDVPPNWTCPECGARKEDFELIEI